MIEVLFRLFGGVNHHTGITLARREKNLIEDAAERVWMRSREIVKSEKDDSATRVESIPIRVTPTNQ
jgi:hypothetical protein